MPELGRNRISELSEQEKNNLIVEIGETTTLELNEFQGAFTEAEDAYNYLAGEQFTSEEKEWFRTNDRPVRAFNLIFPRINQLLGDFLLTNQKRKVYSLSGGNAQIAELIQKLLDQLYSTHEVRSELVMTALGGLTKFGYAYPRVSNEKKIDGSLVVGNVNEFEVMFDSRSQHPFLDDARYVIRFRKLDPDDIVNAWSEHRTELKRVFGLMNNNDERLAYQETLTNREQKLHYSSDMLDRFEGKYTVIEFHKMLWKRRPVFTDLLTGDSQVWPEDLSEEKKEFFLRLHPVHKISERMVRIKQITTVIPAIKYMLEHYDAPLQDGKHDIIKFTFYPYGKKAIKDFGVYKNMKDPQDGFNEFNNKKDDVLLKLANPGHTYRPDLLENAEDVELYGSRPGQDYKVKPAATSLDQAIRTNDWGNPEAALRLVQDSSDLIDKVSGMASNFLFGQTQTSNENATLFAQRVQQTQQAFQIGYTQWARFNQRLDNKSIKLMQLYYTEEKAMMITTPFNADPQRLIINQRIGQFVVNDIGVDEFESVVDDTNSTPTMRLLRFQLKTQLLDQLARWYGPAIAQAIPIDWYLQDAIDLGDVQPLIESIQALMQSQGASAEEEAAIGRVQQIADAAQQQMSLQQQANQIVEQGQVERNGRGQPAGRNNGNGTLVGR